ncbi:hypothetical protein QAD02_005495, partial [Eretmocerus hayati]
RIPNIDEIINSYFDHSLIAEIIQIEEDCLSRLQFELNNLYALRHQHMQNDGILERVRAPLNPSHGVDSLDVIEQPDFVNDGLHDDEGDLVGIEIDRDMILEQLDEMERDLERRRNDAYCTTQRMTLENLQCMQGSSKMHSSF